MLEAQNGNSVRKDREGARAGRVLAGNRGLDESLAAAQTIPLATLFMNGFSVHASAAGVKRRNQKERESFV